MQLRRELYPARVRIDSPSIFQPYHNLHGKIGIAVFKEDRAEGHIRVYFAEGNVHSMLVDPLYLVPKN